MTSAVADVEARARQSLGTSADPIYQAVADGTYAKYGLDVTIVPGGPQVNNRMLLLARKIDFFMSANSLQGFDAVAQDIPAIGFDRPIGIFAFT